jgi:transposase
VAHASSGTWCPREATPSKGGGRVVLRAPNALAPHPDPTRAEAELSARERAYLTTLKQVCPQIAEAQQLLTTFHMLVTERASAQLDCWLQQCERSGIAEFVRFAQGLRRDNRDEAAVRAALCYPWSQGPVEGQINRLKLLKRQMYGRAGFALSTQYSSCESGS